MVACGNGCTLLEGFGECVVGEMRLWTLGPPRQYGTAGRPKGNAKLRGKNESKIVNFERIGDLRRRGWLP